MRPDAALISRADPAHLQLPLTVYRTVHDNTGTETTLGDILHQIVHGGKWARLIKDDRPAFLPAGIMRPKRGNDNLTEPIGVLVYDYDDVDEPARWRDQFTYDHILAAFISPSGTGVKVLVKCDPIPTTVEEHRQAWSQIAAKLPDRYGMTDPLIEPEKADDPSRMCIMSHDPHAWIGKGYAYQWNPKAKKASKPSPPPQSEDSALDAYNDSRTSDDFYTLFGSAKRRGNVPCPLGGHTGKGAEVSIHQQPDNRWVATFHCAKHDLRTVNYVQAYAHLHHNDDMKSAIENLHIRKMYTSKMRTIELKPKWKIEEGHDGRPVFKVNSAVPELHIDIEQDRAIGLSVPEELRSDYYRERIKLLKVEDEPDGTIDDWKPNHDLITKVTLDGVTLELPTRDIMVIMGDGDTGKSALACRLIEHWARQNTPTRIIGSEGQPTWYLRIRNSDLTKKQRELIRINDRPDPDAELVVIDAASDFIAHHRTDENSATGIATLYRKMRQRWPQALIVLVHHRNKGNALGHKTARGSGRITEHARLAILCQHKKNGQQLTYDKWNLGRKPRPILYSTDNDYGRLTIIGHLPDHDDNKAARQALIDNILTEHGDRLAGLGRTKAAQYLEEHNITLPDIQSGEPVKSGTAAQHILARMRDAENL